MANHGNDLIPLDTYGTADWVTCWQIAKEVCWGGFTARLYGGAKPGAKWTDRGTILLSADHWIGPQPRLVLEWGTEGYDDWFNLLRSRPVEPYLIRFVGSPLADRGWGQWVTLGPSPLLRNHLYETEPLFVEPVIKG